MLVQDFWIAACAWHDQRDELMLTSGTGIAHQDAGELRTWWNIVSNKPEGTVHALGKCQ
jgi:hypothetical protein